MPRIVQCLAVAAMLVSGVGGANADTEADARQLGEIFCTLGKGGGQFGRMYLVTRSLTQAINDAQKKNDEIAAAQPDEKPPLGDGIPYQSFPDEAPVCAPGKLTDKGREQVVEITYSFPGMADASWTDRLVLFLRIMAGVSLIKGLYHWVQVTGMFVKPEDAFELQSIAWQASTIFFAAPTNGMASSTV